MPAAGTLKSAVAVVDLCMPLFCMWLECEHEYQRFTHLPCNGHMKIAPHSILTLGHYAGLQDVKLLNTMELSMNDAKACKPRYYIPRM